ncbi:MAG: hypothetical protein WAL52_00305 [Candidatus Sulfotelmatobacter sp.]
MKRSQRNTLFAVVMGAVLSLSAATMATAQSFSRAIVQADESNGKTANGENGYTIGCSFAASLDIPSCGELPSGKQFLAQPEVSSPDVSSEDDATPEDDNDADNQDEVDQDLQAQQEAAQNLINAIQHPVWMNLPSPAQVQESKRPQIINGGQSPAGASQCVGQRCF